MRAFFTIGVLVAAVPLAFACSSKESTSGKADASGEQGGAGKGSIGAGNRGGSGNSGGNTSGGGSTAGGLAGSDALGGESTTGGRGGAGAAGAGGSCLTYCDESQDQNCATTPLADCQNYCRQSFGPQCPEAKETWYRCILESGSVCMDKHVCDDEYNSFVALGCLGMAR